MFAGGRGGGCCGTMEDSWPEGRTSKGPLSNSDVVARYLSTITVIGV